MSNVCVVFGEYSDKMAEKPVSDSEKGESGMQKFDRSSNPTKT